MRSRIARWAWTHVVKPQVRAYLADGRYVFTPGDMVIVFKGKVRSRV